MESSRKLCSERRFLARMSACYRGRVAKRVLWTIPLSASTGRDPVVSRCVEDERHGEHAERMLSLLGPGFYRLGKSI